MPIQNVVIENITVLPKSAAKVAAAFLVLTTLPITPAKDVTRLKPQARYFQETEVFVKPQTGSLNTLGLGGGYNATKDVRRQSQAKVFSEPDTFLKTAPISTIAAELTPVPPALQISPYYTPQVVIENLITVKSQRGSRIVIDAAGTPTSADLLSGMDTIGWPPEPDFFFAVQQKGTPGVINSFPVYNPATDVRRAKQALAFAEAETFLKTAPSYNVTLNVTPYNPARDVTRLKVQAKYFQEADTFALARRGFTPAVSFTPYSFATDVRRAKQSLYFEEQPTQVRIEPYNALIINGTAIPPPSPPILSGVAGPLSATLTWTAPAGALTYSVYQGLSSGGETLLVSGLAVTNYVSTGLLAGTTYYFEVTATGLTGTSGYSNEVALVPLVGAVRVQAVYAGFYKNDYKDIGDVFDIASMSDFSDSSVSFVPPGNPDYPVYGWMKIVPSTTPLFSWASTGNSSPRQSPRRTVV
jgi:hypothetical protein